MLTSFNTSLVLSVDVVPAFGVGSLGTLSGPTGVLAASLPNVKAIGCNEPLCKMKHVWFAFGAKFDAIDVLLYKKKLRKKPIIEFSK